MITTAELRTVRIALEGGRILVPRRDSVSTDPEELQRAAERYDLPAPLAPDVGEDPFKLAEALLPIAKRMLQRDGGHVRLMHIRTPYGWILRGIDAQDRTEKYAILRQLAHEVQSLQGDAIVEIGEAWMATLEEFRAGRLPEQAQDRKEVLVVSVATAEGRFRSYDTVFTRDTAGTIVLGATEIHDAAMPAYMAPFCEIWGLPMPNPAEDGAG